MFMSTFRCGNNCFPLDSDSRTHRSLFPMPVLRATCMAWMIRLRPAAWLRIPASWMEKPTVVKFYVRALADGAVPRAWKELKGSQKQRKDLGKTG